MNLSKILTINYPGAEWTLNGLEYAGLNWLDSTRPKPTEAELIALWDSTQVAERNNKATENRRSAYLSEADPLFFKAQRGEATMDEWQAKVAEIKARFPKE